MAYNVYESFDRVTHKTGRPFSLFYKKKMKGLMQSKSIITNIF